MSSFKESWIETVSSSTSLLATKHQIYCVLEDFVLLHTSILQMFRISIQLTWCPRQNNSLTDRANRVCMMETDNWRKSDPQESAAVLVCLLNLSCIRGAPVFYVTDVLLNKRSAFIYWVFHPKWGVFVWCVEHPSCRLEDSSVVLLTVPLVFSAFEPKYWSCLVCISAPPQHPDPVQPKWMKQTEDKRADSEQEDVSCYEVI